MERKGGKGKKWRELEREGEKKVDTSCIIDYNLWY